MILTGDYHTHTQYSHGKNTVEENAKQAKELGLQEIGICDHGFSHTVFAQSMIERIMVQGLFLSMSICFSMAEHLIVISVTVLLNGPHRRSLSAMRSVCSSTMTRAWNASAHQHIGYP